MKTVLMLRHAKSDWGEPGKVDFDRPLARRGEQDAPRMGEVLALFDCVPDLILASPALRARQTVELVAKACGYKKTIRWEESFYGGGSEDLIAALQGLSDTVERPMLVGHNPTMEETVAELCAAICGDEGEDWSIRIPTAGLVCLDLDIMAWADLEAGDGILRWFLIPKLVRAIQA